ncbi:pantoate--beta-alanine ligase [Ekhidna sp.]|uniref:pantoate--beta-alanine ligase n=1 Tax=Ekhidna sp. TaxID=2608089 RepID=UPI0032ED5D3D
MRHISSLGELKDTISGLKKNGKTIGFVPTMGALHEGHLSLIRKSKAQNDFSVVSIFVNPLQFNNTNDLDAYPRVLNEDLMLLKKHNVDLVFTPSEKDLYPSNPIVSIDFGPLSTKLEGKFRKGHFEGVGVVVSKFFHLVDPNRAYFGLKDLQQFILIRKMCEDLSFNCEVVGVETIREESGLALSSRNRRLSKEGLNTAAIIHRGLLAIKEGVEKREPLSKSMKKARALYQGKNDFELEYLEAIDPTTLDSVEEYFSLTELAICVAGYVEGVRLIDNLYLRLKE